MVTATRTDSRDADQLVHVVFPATPIVYAIDMDHLLAGTSGTAMFPAGVDSIVLGMSGTSLGGFAVADRPAREGDDDESIPTAAAIRALHEKSGLRWSELAQAFGVNRRALNHWANGGTLSARNAALLNVIDAIINNLEATTPEARRATLMAPRPIGVSRFRELVQMAADVVERDPTHFKPWELISEAEPPKSTRPRR